MQIYVINLDRHPARWQRMESLLQGLAYKRVAAVDGKTIEGPEQRDYSLPKTYEILSRYERGCILSHRSAWQEFLAGGDPYCCVLEDDVFISPDFARFVNDEAWIPKDCSLLKIETVQLEVCLSRKTIPCFDRQTARLCSLHLGTAAYIVSRRAAKILLAETLQPALPMDLLFYEDSGRQKLHPVYQLVPALCIQAKRKKDGIIFAEMESAIQPRVETKKSSAIPPAPETFHNKIKRELSRPIRQFFRLLDLFKDSMESAGRAVFDRFKGIRRCKVPFG
ncbi:MAG: glycosyltransferase family 25 protein [Limisphaerales bacterium]